MHKALTKNAIHTPLPRARLAGSQVFSLHAAPVFLPSTIVERLAGTVNIRDTQRDRTTSFLCPSVSLALRRRGSIHPNVSLFHNKIVIRWPDWLGSLEGSHNAPWACPCSNIFEKGREEERESLRCLVVGGCRCVNRAPHQETHAPLHCACPLV